jgi:hypothetical protein
MHTKFQSENQKGIDCLGDLAIDEKINWILRCGLVDWIHLAQDRSSYGILWTTATATTGEFISYILCKICWT